jgi:putative addiction module killer protein
VIEIRQYVDSLGRNPFERWFDKLNDTATAKVTVSLDRLERGNLSAIKSVGEGVQELRIDFGPGYRIYFGRDGERLVILLGGSTKSRQQVEISRAKILWQEYKHRKQEEAWHSQKPSTKQ